MKSVLTSFLILTLIFTIGCNSDKDQKDKQNNNQPENLENITENPLILTIEEPKTEHFFLGDKIKITCGIKDKTSKDSIFLSVNDEEIAVLSNENTDFLWDTKNAHCGKNIIEIETLKNDTRFRKQKIITLFSNLKPEEYTYKIKNVYKHDIKAYTQGLFYHDGFLYEATGLKGESTVRKVKFETGEVLQSFAIPKDVFGEGITLYNNKIIQISWQAGRGFIYDINTFKHLGEFSYSGEGWGITNDDKYLYMTNGSSEVKVLEPETYSVVKTFSVYNNEGPVKYLNELEYIDGYIYANVYQYDNIVKFDPETGQIVGNIDLSHILPMNDYTHYTDVLNGIAYDKENKRLFVTGKLWPKLFEIELVKK